MTATPTHQALQPEFRLLVLLVSIGFFMQGLDTTIINTALPAIAENLQEDPLRMYSVVVAYVLSVAACIPLSGWLADRFGVRNTYFSAIVIFTLASIGCAYASSLNELLFYRVLQGIGGAFLLPVGRLAMLKIIPRTQFLSAMSLMSLAGLIGPLIGPTLGGWLVEVASWHWIFLINLPIGILGVLITFKAMPNITEPSVPQFDFWGFILLLIAMVGLSLGIENVASPLYSLWWSIALVLLGLLSAGLYAYHAHTHQNALFRSKLFRHRIYAIGILGNSIARLAGNSIPFLLPLMLQLAFGFEPFVTGLMMIPTVLGSLASKPIIRQLIQRFGYRQVLITNTLLVGACIASFALTTADTPIWLRALHFFIFGLLNSLQFVSMNTLTLKDLPQQDASSGNSFLSMIMMLSMSIGVALAGTLVNLFSAYWGPEQVVAAFHASLICLGSINLLAAMIFWKIPKNTPV
ncbi:MULTISPECIES: multidrug transporter subunit MdtD [Acinetobacter]|uniref:DHA2 family efflux MFS transporter permease subunit n=1 Tax=Acinetobacter indicus TaxID=756892 RepID=A0A7S6VPR0_9GAMM|nr:MULTISPECIES: multidrug transporter subunit MdtD [Acinetobacter]QIC75045.1 DHA2 family efflux MFS transporter permease subunit [Acinetobacter indicus]QOW42639.1 DHA2 family efflux MFS transporter permease subunit [Acinetobacter indicus]RVT34158.1 DHA2 family efflux MFS transporter permease subunit [Acinetobacter indicus]UNW04487.1 multidrug transporter subunit MdtD [Acinetobacter indicus]